MRILTSLLSATMLVSSLWAQESTNAQLEADIAPTVKKMEAPPINMNVGIGFQSNIDQVDETQFKQAYTNNSLMDFNAGTKISAELLDRKMVYAPSLSALLLQAPQYIANDDVLKSVQFKNNFWMKAVETDNYSFGPTLDLNYDKRYTYYGIDLNKVWRRKRDNINGAIGLKLDATMDAKLKVQADASVGYVDHLGNYTNPDSGFRKSEKNLQEDRTVVNANLTTVYAATQTTMLSIPLSYKVENYTQKRARVGKVGNKNFNDAEFSTYLASLNRPAVSRTLDLAYETAGLQIDQTMMQDLVANAGYTFQNVAELNDGAGRNNADIHIYSLGLTYKLEGVELTAGYSAEDDHYNHLLGGGKEYTHVYSGGVKIPKAVADLDLALNLSTVNYQEAYQSGDADSCNNNIAMVGLSGAL